MGIAEAATAYGAQHDGELRAERENVEFLAEAGQILTAFARKEDRMKALVAGFNAHLAKPVEPAALIAMIADLVGRTAP